MPKTFYTERDIEDLAARGVISLVEDDNVVLTDLARDKAMRLGIEIVHEYDQPPSAPERPYIAKLTSPSATVSGQAELSRDRSTSKAPITGSVERDDELLQTVREAVVARLGDAVDLKLLDTIIRRVLQNVGVK